MSRLDILKTSVDTLYQEKRANRADWADWLYAHHVFVVAETASTLADRFGANAELAVAAGMLHDIADATMSRFDPQHEEESVRIARRLLKEAGFSDEEVFIVVDDAIKRHSCRNGVGPAMLEGKVMATADAVVHLKTDFYEHAVEAMRGQKTLEQIRAWALPKIERDFANKIFFDEVREEVREDHERLIHFFSQELR